MSFLSRLSGGSTKKEKESKASASAEVPSPPCDADTAGIGSPIAAEGDDTAEDELESAAAATSGVHFVSFHQSLLQQRQSVLPHYTHCVWGDYTEDDLAGTLVRGAGYLSDRVKVACGPALYTLAHADIFYTRKVEERIMQLSSRSDGGYLSSPQHAQALARDWGRDPAAATLVINLAFPGPRSSNMNLVLYFERRVPPADVLAKMKDAAATVGGGPEFGDETLVGVDVSRVRAYDVTLRRFRQGSDSYRNGKLKIIPRVAEGAYIVRKTIGRIPALLGKKLKTAYRVDDSVLEVDADVGSSKVAGKIISLVKSTCKALVVDMTFLLQGDGGDELPESLIGGVRIAHCDIDKIPHYEDNVKANTASFSKQQ